MRSEITQDQSILFYDVWFVSATCIIRPKIIHRARKAPTECLWLIIDTRFNKTSKHLLCILCLKLIYVEMHRTNTRQQDKLPVFLYVYKGMDSYWLGAWQLAQCLLIWQEINCISLSKNLWSSDVLKNNSDGSGMRFLTRNKPEIKHEILTCTFWEFMTLSFS